VYKILVGKLERKILVGRPRRRLEDNIKTDLKKVECENVDFVHLTQDRVEWRALVNTVVDFWSSIKGGEIYWLAKRSSHSQKWLYFPFN
jgi:hypothetical protein